MRDVVLAGTVLADDIKFVERYPQKGMLANILSLSRSVGGCVPNVAISLAALDPGLKISAIGAAGADERGDYVRARMAERGIDVSGVRNRDLPTSFSDVVTERESGERTFLHCRGANAALTAEDVLAALPECRLFHLGYLLLLDALDAPDAEYGTAAARLLAAVRERGIATSVDVASECSDRYRAVVLPALRFCDCLIVNEVEAGEIAGIAVRRADGSLSEENVRRVLAALVAAGVKKKVIVHAPECGFSLSAAGEYRAVRALRLPAGYIKGAVGAGDAFCAGVLYGLLAGYESEKLLAFAAGAAACNLSAADSVGGMRPAEDVKALVDRYGEEKICW